MDPKTDGEQKTEKKPEDMTSGTVADGTGGATPPKNPPHRPIDPNSERQRKQREKEQRDKQRAQAGGEAARAGARLKNPVKMKLVDGSRDEPDEPEEPREINEELVKALTPACAVVMSSLINAIRAKKGKPPAPEAVALPCGQLGARVLVKRFPDLMDAWGDECMLAVMFFAALDIDLGLPTPAKAEAA